MITTGWEVDTWVHRPLRETVKCIPEGQTSTVLDQQADTAIHIKTGAETQLSKVDLHAFAHTIVIFKLETVQGQV